jgi:hypothetical protein
MAISLPPNRLQRAEHYCVHYAVVLPGGVLLDTALMPEYWAHVGRQLRRHDMVRIIPEDGSYFAEALVLDAGSGFAKVKLLRRESLEETSEETGDLVTLFVKYNGPHDKWTVIRKSDGEKLKTGAAEKADAERWMSDHLKSMDR